MASTSSASSSLVQKSFFKYDVFLSFRGEDTRKTFVDHLYLALVNKGIITYKNDERIEKGERISEQLIKSIEESRFYIIVFSKNYASSSWCLDELVHIMDCQKTREHTAYPVFFDVEPREVRHQSGAVAKAFAKHVQPLDRLCSVVASCCSRSSSPLNCFTVDILEKEDDVGRWRNALKEAAGLAGMELKNTFNGHEAKFIQQIVEMVSLKLHFFNSNVDGKLVGMETRVKKIVSSLELGFDDVRIIGIKGMGGAGKTTLARAVFDYISVSFEGKSFVENVREVSKGSLSGLKEMQKQILSAVLNDKSIDVENVYDGKNMMKKMMPIRKILRSSIPEVPKDLWQLQSLEKLKLFMKEIQHLPASICMLKHLKHLQLDGCHRLEQLPENICRLECLEELCLTFCGSLRDIPNNICKMKCLKVLHLTYCSKIEKLPEELGFLECLKELNIYGAGISRLPQSIYQLKGLRIIGSTEKLRSNGFTSFTKLFPENPSSNYYVAEV